MTPITKIGLILTSSIALMTGACADTNMGDLRAYTESVLARPGGKISPLPAFSLPRPVVTQRRDRNPFRPFFEKTVDKPLRDSKQGLTEQQINEIFHRNPEELETFELDSLRMTGVLKNSTTDWGLIRAPDGVIHRVRTGDYLGRNFGKIIELNDDRIELREIIQDSQGIWHERTARIALTES